MYNITHKDFSCILSILESIEKIQNYSKEFINADDFYNDTKSFDAAMMNFIVIGEMGEKLSSEFINETSNVIDWPKIKEIISER
ncbi:MAG: hypothetical protein GXO86_06540 [Chlorobi bacterium]|nr:hypothetical protein [Chlorobiota bacterium]